MKLINLTPHILNVQREDGILAIEPSGNVARVSSTTTVVGEVAGIPVIVSEFGDIDELPAPVQGVVYLVSGLVNSRPEVAERADVFSPATGPHDGVVRDEAGRISAVTKLKLR